MSEHVHLYRVENPNIPPDPRHEGEGGTSHPELRGRWFSPDLDKVLDYLPKATQHRPSGTGRRSFEPIDGAVLHIAEVPAEDLGSYEAAKHHLVLESDMDIEPSEDYILPNDAVTHTLSVDDLVGEARGKMNNWEIRQAAINRVRGAVAIHLAQTSEQLDSDRT